VVDMDTDVSVRRIVELCDPKMELKSESQFIAFWMRARSAIDMFMTTHNHPLPHTSDETRGSI
jgi:hypothetical protein